MRAERFSEKLQKKIKTLIFVFNGKIILDGANI